MHMINHQMGQLHAEHFTSWKIFFCENVTNNTSLKDLTPNLFRISKNVVLLRIYSSTLSLRFQNWTRMKLNVQIDCKSLYYQYGTIMNYALFSSLMKIWDMRFRKSISRSISVIGSFIFFPTFLYILWLL